jgi:hypothetical protein
MQYLLHELLNLGSIAITAREGENAQDAFDSLSRNGKRPVSFTDPLDRSGLTSKAYGCPIGRRMAHRYADMKSRVGGYSVAGRQKTIDSRSKKRKCSLHWRRSILLLYIVGCVPTSMSACLPALAAQGAMGLAGSASQLARPDPIHLTTLNHADTLLFETARVDLQHACDNSDVLVLVRVQVKKFASCTDCSEGASPQIRETTFDDCDACESDYAVKKLPAKDREIFCEELSRVSKVELGLSRNADMVLTQERAERIYECRLNNQATCKIRRSSIIDLLQAESDAETGVDGSQEARIWLKTAALEQSVH